MAQNGPAEQVLPVPSQLISEFSTSPAVKDKKYKEDWTRSHYIEPLFEALGWKLLNPAHLTNDSTGFVRQIALGQAGSQDEPDYGFYVDGRRKFYVEAKKPSVNIKLDRRPAQQIRGYGWTSGDEIGVVTDFEEFSVYNCLLKPEEGDGPEIGLLEYIRSSEYEARWPWLAQTFTPSAVRAGALSDLAGNFKERRRLVPVGQAFLFEIEEWRESLAEAIAADNSVNGADLNRLVQTLIDRLIFLRIAEARGLEPEGTLRGCLTKRPIYPALFDLFKLADTRYNSGLFHFASEHHRPTPDQRSEQLAINDAVLAPIIDRLTSDRSPYQFSVLPTDILGQVYERFLGREIELVAGKVSVTQKPEFRKSGGVYYTPSNVVEYIVDRTLGPLLDGKSVAQAKSLRIVDPACGSGSFLISAYQFLLDWHLYKYSQYKRKADQDRFLMRGSDGRRRLRLSERKRILLDNIYGVDIDVQAVEVARLSLLLKVIEGETQTALAVERLLPDLDGNLVAGNSLVGTDFFQTSELISLTSDELEKVSPLDWGTAFPGIAAAGGFDAVVGNPPWLMAGYYVPDSMPYFHRNYETCVGKADLYYLFLEKATRLVSPDGRIGMIVPSKLFHTQAARNLRKLLSSGNWLEEILDFGTERVFQDATNYSCVITMSQSAAGPIRVAKARRDLTVTDHYSLPRPELSESTWHLISPDRRELWRKIAIDSSKLDDLAVHFGNGVQTGSDPLLILTPGKIERLGIEPEICRPILRGRDVRRFSAATADSVLFPYQETEDGEFEILSEKALEQTFPGAYAYLRANRKKLTERKWFKKSPIQRSGKWYGMMYLDEPGSFRPPALIAPSLASGSNFAMSPGVLFVTGTAGVSSVVLSEKDDEFQYFVLAVLNSDLISEYIVDHSTPYQGGYFKFSKPYIRGAPIRVPDRSLRTGRAIVTELAAAAEWLSNQVGDLIQRSAVQHRINELVLDLYEVTEGEAACLVR